MEDTVAELDRTSGSFGAFTVTVIVAAEAPEARVPVRSQVTLLVMML